MHVPETGALDAAGIELADGRRLHGFVEAGYGGVMDAFIANVALRHDVGAACAAFIDGQRVVDVWGGVADARTGRAWQRETSAVIFSCSKGLLAISASRWRRSWRGSPSFERLRRSRRAITRRRGIATTR